MATSPKLLHALTYIAWIDSIVIEGQVGRDELPTPIEIYSVSFVVDETDDYVTLARERMDDDYCGLVSIPTVAVRSRRTLTMELTAEPLPSDVFPTSGPVTRSVYATRTVPTRHDEWARLHYAARDQTASPAD